MTKANVLRIKKYIFSVYYKQNFAFRYTPSMRADVNVTSELFDRKIFFSALLNC